VGEIAGARGGRGEALRGGEGFAARAWAGRGHAVRRCVRAVWLPRSWALGSARCGACGAGRGKRSAERSSNGGGRGRGARGPEGCAACACRLDPSEVKEISTANSRQNVRKLIKDGFILRKPEAIHTRANVQVRNEAKAKGRHMGLGKRKGARNARLPVKVLWLRRLRVLRRMLKKYREQSKIDRNLYHELYAQVKGNKYKTKKQLMEVVHRLKAEKARMHAISEQARVAKEKADARRQKISDRSDRKKAEANA
jgi:large subunit ribosomal protein L19e